MPFSGAEAATGTEWPRAAARPNSLNVCYRGRIQSAYTLGTSIDDLIGAPAPRDQAKCGPAPKIQRQLERISTLPKPDQRAVMRVLDSMLAQAR